MQAKNKSYFCVRSHSLGFKTFVKKSMQQKTMNALSAVIDSSLVFFNGCQES